MTSKLPLLLLLTAVTCLSQFYRVSNSVIAPELARDLHLSARQLGWAGSALFFALFAVAYLCRFRALTQAGQLVEAEGFPPSDTQYVSYDDPAFWIMMWKLLTRNILLPT